MMIFLYIFARLLLLILLILSLRVKLTLTYHRDKGSPPSYGVLAGAGPVRLRVFPKKEKPLRLKDYSPKKFRKRMLREKALEEKKKKKASASKKTEGDKKKKESPVDFKELFSDGFGEALEFVVDILVKFGRRLRCDVIKLSLRVGAKDAAAVAYTTFCVSEGANAVMSLIDSYATLKLKAPQSISVTPDFEGDAITGDVNIVFSIRVGSAIAALSGVIVALIKQMISKDKE